MDCIFCKIANKQVPATIIYEDDLVVAFDDMHPKAPYHKLIIPRQHFATLNDLKEQDKPIGGHMLYTAQKIAKQLGIAEDGYRVLLNCNRGGGQVVFHVHLHLLGGRITQWLPE
jgi:histidine triad (HIT) family protein